MSCERNNIMDIDVQSDYHGQAFTSDLSGEDFWLVIDKGFLLD